MLAFRKDLMDVILHSPNRFAIEELLHELMNRRFRNVTSELVRFLKLLESDINFQLRQSHSTKKQRNLIEAYLVIKEINFETKTFLIFKKATNNIS